MLPGLYRSKREYQPLIPANVWEYSHLTLCYNGRRGKFFWWFVTIIRIAYICASDLLNMPDNNNQSGCSVEIKSFKTWPYRWRTTKVILLYDHYNIMSNYYIPKHSLIFWAGIPLCLDISLVTYQNFNPASVITFSTKITFVDIPPGAQCFDISLPAKETFSLTATKSISSGGLTYNLIVEI